MEKQLQEFCQVGGQAIDQMSRVVNVEVAVAGIE